MGIYSAVSVKLPSPAIVADGKEVSAVQGTYCWGGLIKSACADPISPPDLNSSHSMKPVVVSPIAKNESKKNTLTVTRVA